MLYAVPAGLNLLPSQVLTFCNKGGFMSTVVIVGSGMGGLMAGNRKKGIE